MKKERIGEIHSTKLGESIEIIDYISCSNVKVKFNDGVVLNGLRYTLIIKGEVLKPRNRLGEKHRTSEGYEAEIIEYFNSLNCTIKFDDGTVVNNKKYREIKNGSVKNPNHKTVYGIGYIGQGRYKVTTTGKNKPYKKWHSLIQRCYDVKAFDRHPTYESCSVDERWHNFQVFAEWFENNYIEGFELDKDILVKGNKIYSPETCCFVPQGVNALFTNRKNHRGDCPIGVSKIKNKFAVFLSKNGERYYLGVFDTPKEAFECYKFHKEKYIKEIADKWRGQITEECYRAMYNYEVEITD